MQCDPKYAEILSSYKDINLYKYAAYRMALKLRRLQKACKLDLIDLSIIFDVCRSKECQLNMVTLSKTESESICHALFEAAKLKLGYSDEPETLSRILLSFLSSAFCQNSNYVYLYELKVVLILLSAAKLSDKQKYIFQQFATDGIDKMNFKSLLKCLAKISEVMGEKLTFGTSFVSAAVESCFHLSKGHEKIQEVQFLEWLSYEPQSLVWLSTHYRLSVAEKVQHDVKCNVCKAHPLIGLRYKCLCCFGYNLCQQCFLRGFVNRGHQAKHLVQEFCLQATAWEETKTALKIVRNKLLFTGKRKQNFLEFKNVATHISDSKTSIGALCENDSTLVAFPSKYTAIKELSTIITKLEEENRQIDSEIKRLYDEGKNEHACPFNTNKKFERWINLRKKSLQDHNDHLELQLQRLKQLLLNLKTPVNTDDKQEAILFESPQLKLPYKSLISRFESTPVAAGKDVALCQNLSKFIRLRAELDGLKNLSKTTASLDTPETVLYSIADMEMDEYTNYSDSRKDLSKILTTNCDTINNSNAINESCLLNKNKFYSKNDSFFQRNFCSGNNVFASTKLNSHGSILSSPVEVSLKYSSPSSLLLTKSCLQSMSSEEKSSIEFVESELQKILEHLENISPKVAELQNSIPIQNNRFMSALTEMEDALKKLSLSVTNENY